MSAEQSAVSSVSVLADRVADLEQKVFGGLDKNDQYTKATDVLLGFNSRLVNVLSDFERAVMVMKRIDELERYLEPLYYHQVSASSSQLTAELVCVQPQLTSLAQQLKMIDQMIPLLDSQHIKDVSGLRARVDQVKRRHQHQSQRQHQLSQQLEQIKQLCCQLTHTITLSTLQLNDKTAKLPV